MEEPQVNPDSLRGPELVVPDPLQTPFAKPPGYGEVSGGNVAVQPGGGSGKRVLKWVIILSVVVISILGGYFALNRYFPEYAKYVNPYLGPVLDPVLEQVQPVLDKIGLSAPSTQVTSMPSPQPLPSDAGLPRGDEVALRGWKTYRNFEYGFEFKYPKDWRVSPEKIVLDSEVRIELDVETKPGFGDFWPGNLVRLDLSKNENKLALEAFLKEGNRNQLEDQITQTQIAGASGIRITFQDDIDPSLTGVFVCFTKDNSWRFCFDSAGDDVKILDQILSTFKFPPDADGDGLPDDEEPNYNTNPNNPDMDDDGYLDGQEVQNGYNPLGPGRATQ